MGDSTSTYGITTLGKYGQTPFSFTESAHIPQGRYENEWKKIQPRTVKSENIYTAGTTYEPVVAE